MKIELNKSYKMDNLVTLSCKVKVSELQKVVVDMVKEFKEYTTNNGEYMITTTKSIEVINGEQILDIEILLPVFDLFVPKKPYDIKETIKIANAIYAIADDITKLQETMDEINNYIIANRLQAITSAYLVQTKKHNLPYTEIYIGLNPNIL
jgi:hypothetical protein